MHCPQLQLEPGQQDTLACEFDDGSRVNAAWDDEGQTASYMLPKVTRYAIRLQPDTTATHNASSGGINSCCRR
jgi:hypothetical protein